MTNFLSLNNSQTVKRVAFQLTERYDRKKLSKLVNSDFVNDDDKQCCNAILTKLGRKQCMQVNYSVPDNQFDNESFIGRLYCGANTYQSLNRDLRNFLACDLYVDYDIENCHPVLLTELCLKLNIPVQFIYKLSDRTGLCHELNIDVNTLKNELRLITNKENHKSEYPLLANIHNEIYGVVVPRLKREFPEIVSWVPDSKTWNRAGSFLSFVLNYNESMVVKKYIEFFKSRCKIDVNSIIHDGFLIEKKKIVNDRMLSEANQYVFEDTGFRMNLVAKPMHSKYFDFDFDAGFLDSNVLVDDAYAGKTLADVCEGEIVYCRTSRALWHFNRLLGIWTNDLNDLHEKISKEYIDKLIFKQLDARGCVKVFNYAGLVSNRRKMLEMCVDFVKKYDYFIEEQIDTSRCKFLFKNGIYDCVTDKFTAGFDKNIVFLYKLEFDFSRDFNKAFYDKAQKLMFVDPFTTEQLEQGLGDYYRWWLGNRLKGFYEKSLLVCEGISNSGKSTTCIAIKTVFGNYVADYESDNLVMKSKEEPEKNMKWLIGKNNKRILFANEPSKESDEDKKKGRSIHWNGAMIARMTGNDEIQARRLNENLSDRGFTCRAAHVVYCNKMANIAGDHLAIKNRLRGIEFNKCFVDEIVNPEIHLLKDVTIQEEFIKNKEFKLAFFWLLISAKEVKTPQCVLDYTDELLGSSDVELKFINEFFVIGGGFSNYVNRKEVENICEEMNMNYRDIRKRLANLGVLTKDAKGVERFREDGGFVRRYFNITLKQ